MFLITVWFVFLFCMLLDIRLLIHNSSIRNIALHDLTLMKTTVALFEGTGNFLVTFHNKYTRRQFKKSKIFKQTLLFYLKKGSKF